MCQILLDYAKEMTGNVSKELQESVLEQWIDVDNEARL